MRQAMQKWLNKSQIAFDTDTANSICNSLGLDGEKVDECLGLCYQLEKGDINEADFTGGLCVLTGKKPEEVMGVLKDMKPKVVPDAEIANLEKIITEGGRDISLIKEWARTEGVSQAQYLQRLKEVIEDLSIPKTFVTSLGIEVEIPVAMALETLVLAGESTISSGFHGALNQRWTIVFRGKISDRVAKAAKAVGLEVTYREGFPYISLPGVGITEIDRATEVFNKFAGLYEEK